MNIALYSRTDNSSIEEIKKILFGLNITFSENPCSTKGFDMAVSYGGDGTFLSAVRLMGDNLIPILGINSGRLGFLSTVERRDAHWALNEVLLGRYSIQKRTLLEIDSTNGIHHALNEFTLQKKGSAMIKINIEIDSLSVASYWADGVIVSTPSGSTAYSMSVGGAIMAPDTRAFIISPIAPHNLNIRPLVVPDTSVIKVWGECRDCQQVMATIDNRNMPTATNEIFKMGQFSMSLDVVQLSDSSFYGTLREKLLWGVDARE